MATGASSVDEEVLDVEVDSGLSFLRPKNRDATDVNPVLAPIGKRILTFLLHTNVLNPGVKVDIRAPGSSSSLLIATWAISKEMRGCMSVSTDRLQSVCGSRSRNRSYTALRYSESLPLLRRPFILIGCDDSQSRQVGFGLVRSVS